MPPPPVHGEPLDMTVFRDGALWEVIWFSRGHADGDHMIGLVSVFIKRDGRELACSPALSLPCEDAVRRQPSVSREESPYQKPTMLAP